MKELVKRRSEFVGIVGRHAVHIFDKVNRVWISSSADLGYESLMPNRRGSEEDEQSEEVQSDDVQYMSDDQEWGEDEQDMSHESFEQQ